MEDSFHQVENETYGGNILCSENLNISRRNMYILRWQETRIHRGLVIRDSFLHPSEGFKNRGRGVLASTKVMLGFILRKTKVGKFV